MGHIADRLAVPRVDQADSFVLHSGLELLARSALLPHVRPDRRGEAIARLRELGDGFEAFGDGLDEPHPRAFDDVAAGARFLVEAISRGELDDVDAAAAWVGDTATPGELGAHLSDALVPSLAAAGHAPIFLYLLPRVAPRGEVTGRLLRQLAREVARRPEWRLHWFDERPSRPDGRDAGELTSALVATPRLPEPASTFIHPLMSRIDTPELAGAWLGDVTSGTVLGDRPRAVLRVAARSMIGEPTHHAPYGWSHCLTMPQAVLGVAHHCGDPSIALAVAATYLAGFRTLADGPVDDEIPLDPHVPLDEALDAGPRVAAGAAWHGTRTDLAGTIETLATRAAVHGDAHLVKYTLACFDAAADDRGAAPMFMAAAASLAGWWATDGQSA